MLSEGAMSARRRTAQYKTSICSQPRIVRDLLPCGPPNKKYAIKKSRLVFCLHLANLA